MISKSLPSPKKNDFDFTPDISALVHKNKIVYEFNGKTWILDEQKSVSVPYSLSYEKFVFEGNDLFIVTENRVICLDISKAGVSEKWKVPFYCDQIKILENRVLLKGSLPGKKMDIELLPQADQIDFDKELGHFQNGIEMPGRRVVICMDRESKDELWRIQKGVGNMVVSEDRIVMVLDTAITGLKIPFVESSGEDFVLIRQYKMNNGDQMYEEKLDHFNFNSSSLKIVGSKLLMTQQADMKTNIICIKLR